MAREGLAFAADKLPDDVIASRLSKGKTTGERLALRNIDSIEQTTPPAIKLQLDTDVRKLKKKDM